MRKDDIIIVRAQRDRAEFADQLEVLESGKLLVGIPSANRTNARKEWLRRLIAEKDAFIAQYTDA
jgi:hypothetical protein